MNYIYDNTYEGFLTCAYHHWYTEKAEGIFPDELYQLDLCRYAMSVETDAAKAERVLDAVNARISTWDAERIYKVFCSNEPEKEMKMLRYIALGFRHGPKIRLMHGDPVVKAAEAAEQRVGREVHRLCGLVRFSEARDGISGNTLLYAKVELDNDVLEFIAPHFSDRYKSEPFVIHDVSRGKGLFAYGGEWEVMPLEAALPIEASEDEHGYRLLWKGYFDAMGIRERANPKTQRGFMPARYWKHLPEVSGL
ncbi:MAG: TIGR03915 family putative DNA repair protein [Clostridiales bacterium]|nr:TIGR03915 family putative DNA repair protein [Clostridiales bacterium]